MTTSVTTIQTLRSAMKKRKSYSEPIIVDDNFIDLVEYPNYYSLMVVNFASSLTQNIEKIFNDYIVERKRHDIIVITMSDIAKCLQMMRDDLRYSTILANEEGGEEEEEEEEEETNDGEIEISINDMVMVIRDKIDAAVQENERILEQREALAKFRILDFWKTGVGLSEVLLSIVAKKETDSIKKHDDKEPDSKTPQKTKSKKSKKSKSGSILVDQPAAIDPKGTREFTYKIPDYDFTSEIWSKLTKRGQERFDKTYIEDFPFLGPKIYIILLNFHNMGLIKRLIEEKFYLNSIMQILPFGAIDVDHTWNLIDMSQRRYDIFKPISFFEHYITLSEKPITCYRDRMNAYNLICFMFYDADDIRRKYEMFLTNCNVINVEDDIQVLVRPSEIEFLFSNVIEFYLINLFKQLEDDNEDEEENNVDDDLPQPTPPPSIFTLFNNRITIVENGYEFFKKNQSLEYIDKLNTIYYNYISNTNKLYFMQMTKHYIRHYDFSNIKFIKNLTKYAYNEIVFHLNSTTYNEVNDYRCHYYEILNSEYRIVHYKYNNKDMCEDDCYFKTVVPTPLCHRDFNEFLLDEIQPWLAKQEFIYNDLLQDFMYEKYLADLPRHIEFKLKYYKEQDFIYEPSIKLELQLKQQREFESMKQKEYDKVFQYLERKSGLAERQSRKPSSVELVPPDKADFKQLKKLKKSSKKLSVADENVQERGILPALKTRISQIQPFDELGDDMEDGEFHFFREHTTKVPDHKKIPIKAFNVYDLDDTRYQIDVTNRKFHFKNGCVRHCLEDVLYREKYQAIRLRFYWNRFYLNRSFLPDVHERFHTNYIRIVTENDTVINLYVNEESMKAQRSSWTPSSTTLSGNSVDRSSNSVTYEYTYNVSVIINWPNGLKIHITNDEKLSENIIKQEWCEVNGRDNENKRWYFSTGCCVVFCLNYVIMVYTPHGIVYEIGDMSEEEETVEVSESSADYEELEKIYEFELNYITFLSKFVVFNQFNLTLPNGCKIFVQDGKICKFLSQKPDKLLVKEHMDYVLGEIMIRREDGFKMLISSNEQIVIYPDGTIIKSDQLQIIESLDETEFSDVSSVQSENDVQPSGQSIISYFVKQVIHFSTSDHYQFVNRKSLHFFHENYSTVDWDLDTDKISFHNYDRSATIIYNNGTSINGFLKNSYPNEPRSEKVEDLKFHFLPNRMTIDHNNFNSIIYLHYKNYQSYHDHILMSTLDCEYLHRMEIKCDGKVDIIKNISEKCAYKLENPRKPLFDSKFGDRTFLINVDNDDHCFELFTNDIECNRKDDIVKDDDCQILVLNNLNAEVNSNFKSTSDLYARIPDRLATKPDNLCKLDDDTLEIHEKQIKSNFFKKLSNRFGFAYYQKYCDKKLFKSYCCDNMRMEKLCETAINYYVDQEYQRLIDERNAKRERLKPSEAFHQKMREINERHQLTNYYKLMLRFNIVPNYFDFHEHDDHIKNMNVSKYVKRITRIRLCVPPKVEEPPPVVPQISFKKKICEFFK